MAQDHITVGIVIARRKLKGPWANEAWLPIAALPAAPELTVGASLGAEGDEERFYAGPATVTLNSSQTGHYRDNLMASQPSLWVMLRPVGDAVELASVTADPYEGEAMAESMGEIVEAVPMPGDVRFWVQAFVEAFHVERQFVKRKRDRANPDALGRRGPARRGDGER